MRPDRVSRPGPLTYKLGALPTALRGPAVVNEPLVFEPLKFYSNMISSTSGFKSQFYPKNGRLRRTHTYT